MAMAEMTAEQAQLNSALKFYSKMTKDDINSIQLQVYTYLVGRGHAPDSVPISDKPGVSDRNFVSAVMMAQREMKGIKVDGKWGEATKKAYGEWEKSELKGVPYKNISVTVLPLKMAEEPTGRVDIGAIKIIRNPERKVETYAREFDVGERRFRVVSPDRTALDKINQPSMMVMAARAPGSYVQEYSAGEWKNRDYLDFSRALTTAEKEGVRIRSDRTAPM
jgi:hypothetical protein